MRARKRCINHPDRPAHAKYLCSTCYNRAQLTRATAHKYVLSKYGMTPDQYWEMWERQGGLCAICGMAETRSTKSKVMILVVDHDHATGRIRGLLCHKCNSGIGLMNDDPDTIEKALAYIRKVT